MSALTASQLIERWTNVERVLAAMPEHERQNHFDMSVWGKQTQCGTVACAAGTCGLDPWFRERGFKLEFTEKGESRISDVKEFFGNAGTERIFLDTTVRPVETVLDEVREYVGELKRVAALTEGLNAPAIGAEWPEQGGIYAGAMLGQDGADSYLLIVGPAREGWINWRNATKWAAELVVGEHRDFGLPNRDEGYALYDRVQPIFGSNWYWLSEQHADNESYAWVQYFYGGYQYFNHKGGSYRVRAVRRVPLRSFDHSVISSVPA